MQDSKERLANLILNAPKLEFKSGGRAQGRTYQTAQNIADHLIENGVIVPPCKVGDKMYVLLKNPNKEYGYRDGVNEIIVRHIRIRADGVFVSDFWGFIDWKVGERAFLTFEEAENTLKKEKEK